MVLQHTYKMLQNLLRTLPSDQLDGTAQTSSHWTLVNETTCRIMVLEGGAVSSKIYGA